MDFDLSCSFVINQFGNLEITLDQKVKSKEVKKALKYHKTQKRLELWDLCERAICNSEFQLASNYGLTDAPAFGIPVYNEEETEIIDYEELYWFPEYMVVDEIEEILTEGKAIFKKAN